jgi:hypothetical protein
MVAQINKTYLSYGLRPCLKRVLSYAFYEGRPLTTTGRFINPVVFAWLNTLAAIPGNPKAHQPLFITGLGRSGTTLLGVLLSLHRAVGYLNEPKALWYVIDPRLDINGNYSSKNGIFRLGAEHATQQIITRANRLFARYSRLTASSRVVDKYPELIFRVDYVRKLFPNAKFIFITRSGVDAVASIVQWSQRSGVKSAHNIDDWWGRNDLKWHYLRNQLILSDAAYQSVWPWAIADLDHVNRAALEWIVTMREGLKQMQRHPDALVRVSYEALLADPETALERLQQQCDLTPDPAVTDYAKKQLYDNPGKAWPVLLPAINTLFHDTMVMLDYP